MQKLPIALLRGAGDLGSGAAYRLFKAGIPVIICELPQPVCVRRLVCYSNAVYEGEVVIEGIKGILCKTASEAISVSQNGSIAILIDPKVEVSNTYRFPVWVDARMMKRPPEQGVGKADLVIGLGPGFIAGENCDALVETNRGSKLGRVSWLGIAERDTGYQKVFFIIRRIGYFVRRPTEQLRKLPGLAIMFPVAT